MTPLEALWEIRRGFFNMDAASDSPMGEGAAAGVDDLFDRVEAALTEGDEDGVVAENQESAGRAQRADEGHSRTPALHPSPSVSAANPTAADEYTPVEVLEATINLLPSDDPVIYNDAHDALLEIEAELSVLRARAAAADTLHEALALCRSIFLSGERYSGQAQQVVDDALAAYDAAKETT